MGGGGGGGILPYGYLGLASTAHILKWKQNSVFINKLMLAGWRFDSYACPLELC